MIVAQRDYVGRGKPPSTRRNIPNRKRKRSSSSASKMMFALLTTLLTVFVVGMCIISNNKSGNLVTVPNQSKSIDNELPPKPKERWRYIKELENSQVSMQYPTKSTTKDKTNMPVKITNEQRRLLAQMQADMQQESAHLNKIYYSDQSKIKMSATTQIHPMTQTLRNSQQSSAQKNHLRQTPRQITTLTPPIQLVHKSLETTATKEILRDKFQNCLVQCGSFKNMSQAESVRAQLALAGIESSITNYSGWNKVLLGPCYSRTSADRILQDVRAAGISNCIPIFTRG